MKVKMFFKFYCLLIFSLISLPLSFAQDMLHDMEHIFFSKKDNTRVGIEVEFKGLSALKSAEIVKEELGGTIDEIDEILKTTIKGYDSQGKAIYNQIINREYVVRNTRLGDILLKPETNQVTDDAMVDSEEVIVELVSEPIHEKEASQLDAVLLKLENAGATGTDLETAISTQVNVEMFNGDRKKAKVGTVVNLMRAYLRPEHKQQIDERLQVPPIRRPYVEGYSKKMMKQLLNPDYKPTWRELYDDFVYRQSLEVLGDKKAWTDPIEIVQKRLLKRPDAVVPKVVKQNCLRISSLLMWMFPEDPMSRLYDETGWAKARPLVEFREWNSEFLVGRPVRQSLGLMSAVKIYGYFDHDQLVAQLTGVDAKSLVQLRNNLKKAKTSGAPVNYRYYFADPENLNLPAWSRNQKAYEEDALGYINPTQYGKKALYIDGESIVLHRTPFHDKTVLGKFNPNLTNRFVRQVLENKYAEFKFFNDYAPGSIPNTELLSDHFQAGMTFESFEASLRTRFPNGYIIKGVWDLGSEKSILTDSLKIAKTIKAYKNSDFDEYAANLRADQSLVDSAPDYLIDRYKDHPNYLGWKLTQLLNHPEQSIVQEKVNIDRELRIEIIGGKVIGGESTIDRYQYLAMLTKKGRENYRPISHEVVIEAEKYAQNIIDQLPNEFKATPFSVDVALLKDGQFALIESNPGGNSNFLYEERPESIKALTEYLKFYHERELRGEVPKGLSDKEQMTYIKRKFKEWKIDSKAQFPTFKFLADHIEDSDFAEVKPDPKKYEVKLKESGKMKVKVETKETCLELAKHFLVLP
jgi:hypothetical protein